MTLRRIATRYVLRVTDPRSVICLRDATLWYKVVAMDQSQWASENLQVIRTLMERSTLYRRALAPIMLVAGVFGLAAAIGACFVKLETNREFSLYWMSVGVLATLASLLLVRRQALKEDEEFWSLPTRRVSRAVLPAFLAGLLAGVLQVGQNLHNGWHWDADIKAGKAWESGFTSDIRAYGENLTIPITSAFDLIGAYQYGKTGRLQGITGGGNEFVNYWGRTFFVGIRANRLFSRSAANRNPYYFDNRVLTQSPVVPPETR